MHTFIILQVNGADVEVLDIDTCLHAGLLREVTFQ